MQKNRAVRTACLVFSPKYSRAEQTAGKSKNKPVTGFPKNSTETSRRTQNV